MQNQNIQEESPLAEEGRKLFRIVDGQAQCELDNTQKFFIHALLQEMLYNMVQKYCDVILFEEQYNIKCINDGSQAIPIDTLYQLKDVKEYGNENNNQDLENLLHGQILSGRKNPYTGTFLKVETVFFHDIKNEHQKIVKCINDYIYINHKTNCTNYSIQYKQALEVLKDQREMPDYVPIDIQKFVLKYQLEQQVITQEKYDARIAIKLLHCQLEQQVITQEQYDERLLQIEIKLLQIEIKELIKQIENANNPQEIKEIIKISIQKRDSAIEEIKKCNDQINNILESKAFKDECEKAEAFGVEAVKNFVRKLIQSLICIFYRYDENAKKARHDEIDRSDRRTKNFKDFVSTKVLEVGPPQIKQLQ
jgi:hypothetical protein